MALPAGVLPIDFEGDYLAEERNPAWASFTAATRLARPTARGLWFSSYKTTAPLTRSLAPGIEALDVSAFVHDLSRGSRRSPKALFNKLAKPARHWRLRCHRLDKAHWQLCQAMKNPICPE